MSDGPLFMTLLLRNLNDLLNSDAYSVTLIKEEIEQVKENLELIRSFFGKVEQELNRDLWTRVLDVAYRQNMPCSILARDHGLLQLIFLLPGTIEKIKQQRGDGVADKYENNCLEKRYFIVLDDLWDTVWDELTRPFPELQKRSRIVLTSRIKGSGFARETPQ
ncbi:hypothetical protein HAX54_006306 [Datura stramonium]|uniref:NB-ARC domain-containing protein n=1 Tax=Datura stramonium TaxID=4076 RepID=A0ABS8WW04_DATST|nr:hypothetical protein [Datura stramonium]